MAIATTKITNLPIGLDSGLNPLLSLWGGFSASRNIHYAKLTQPIYASNLKGKTAKQKAGIGFERKVVAALARRNFTENLCSFLALANDSYSHSKPVAEITNSKTSNFQVNKNDYLILHNPHFSYSFQKIKRLCIPDILILIPLGSIDRDPGSIIGSYPGSINNVTLPDSISPSILFPQNSDSDLPKLFSFIICIEVKLTYVEIAFEKLKNLYLPVVNKAFGIPVIPLVIVKNLTTFSPKSSPNLSKAIQLKLPLLNYLGSGPIF